MKLHPAIDLSNVAGMPSMRAAPDALDQMLESGADPNLRAPDAEDLLSKIDPDWASCDPPPQFDPAHDQWYPPLYCAARLITPSDEARDEHTRMVTAMIQHGVDLYLEFPQRLYRSPRWLYTRSVFPGEDSPRRREPEYAEDEWNGKDLSTLVLTYDPDEEEREEEPPLQYGRRHVLHAILEDGSFTKPLLDYPGLLDSLDLEHRDPQGRTLLLSSCRNSLGADAHAHAAICDASWNPNIGGLNGAPFPEWDRDSPEWDSPAPEDTVVHKLLQLGADPLATDYQGKNALHHLLAETCHSSGFPGSRPSIVRRTLRFLSTRYPALVNQPDRHETYPLHAALRRLRCNTRRDFYVKIAEMDGCLRDLLRMGADPRARDSKGNTALHYLADEDLAGVWFGREIRQLFYDMLSDYGCGVDVNVRNHAGKTVAELVFEDNGGMENDKDSWYGYLRWDEGVDLRQGRGVDEEVFGRLDREGVDWTAQASDGGTLLHVVARSRLHLVSSLHADRDRAVWRGEFLLSKGVDPTAIDREGRTARDVAVESKNDELVEALDKFGQDIQG